MKVIKATKRFRQISILLSLLFAITSIVMLIVVEDDCDKSNLKATTGLVFFLWSTVFVLLLLQMVQLTECLKKIPKLLFGFYFFICGCMFFVQMELWGGVDNKCRTEVPTLYWWLVTNIILFYLIVSFGLATWGAYLCKVADVQEEVTRKAVKEYLEETDRTEKHFMLTAGQQQPQLMQNGPDAQISAQRLMLTDGQNPYAQQPHSQATMDQYNQLQRQRTQQMPMQSPSYMPQQQMIMQ